MRIMNLGLLNEYISNKSLCHDDNLIAWLKKSLTESSHDGSVLPTLRDVQRLLWLLARHRPFTVFEAIFTPLLERKAISHDLLFADYPKDTCIVLGFMKSRVQDNFRDFLAFIEKADQFALIESLLNTKIQYNRTFLHLVATNKPDQSFQTLLELLKAKMDKKAIFNYLTRQDDYDTTPLHVLANHSSSQALVLNVMCYLSDSDSDSDLDSFSFVGLRRVVDLLLMQQCPAACEGKTVYAELPESQQIKVFSWLISNFFHLNEKSHINDLEKIYNALLILKIVEPIIRQLPSWESSYDLLEPRAGVMLEYIGKKESSLLPLPADDDGSKEAIKDDKVNKKFSCVGLFSCLGISDNDCLGSPGIEMQQYASQKSLTTGNLLLPRPPISALNSPGH